MQKNVLEGLRQPLEHGAVTITLSSQMASFLASLSSWRL
ncbi:MAG: ATP-binding protein [Syntrophales bacterium]